MFKISTVLFLFVIAVSVNAGVPIPSVPDLQVPSDSGWTASDNITKAIAPGFTVAGVTAGATVELLRNGNPVASVVASGASVTLTDALSPPEGTSNYSARQTISGNTGAPSAALAVTFDRTAPAVTLNQAAGQADPVTVLPIKYTITFSEPVFCVGIGLPGPFGECFEHGMFSLAGSTAYIQSAFPTLSGESPIYELSLRYIRSPGTIVVAMNANAFFYDIAGNENLASTSTDNSVTFNPPRITANMNGKITVMGGGIRRPGTMARLTNTTTGDTYLSPVTPGGDYGFTTIPIYDVQDQPFKIEIIYRKKYLNGGGFVMQPNFTYPMINVQY